MSPFKKKNAEVEMHHLCLYSKYAAGANSLLASFNRKAENKRKKLAGLFVTLTDWPFVSHLFERNFVSRCLLPAVCPCLHSLCRAKPELLAKASYLVNRHESSIDFSQPESK